MGYTTTFDGRFSVDPPLNADEISYLQKFASSRRMLMKEGPYYVDQPGYGGQDRGDNVIEYNTEAEGQPSLWCKWEPTDDGHYIEWNGAEKFYGADVWLKYLIDHFLKPGAEADSGEACPTCGHRESGSPYFTNFTFDHVLNGEVDCQGEEAEDRWKLIVTDNVVSVKKAKLVWE